MNIAPTLITAALVLGLSGAAAPASADQPEEVTVCHKYGTPAQNTMTLPYPAAMKHIEAHGDLEGPCPPTSEPQPAQGVPAHGGKKPKKAK